MRSDNSALAASSTYATISASVKVNAGMDLLYATAPWMGKPKVRIMRGIPGVATQAAMLGVTDNAGSLVKKETTSEVGNAISKGLSLLTGAGSITGTSAKYTFTVDPAAYSAGAMKAIAAFNAEVAKAASAAPQP